MTTKNKHSQRITTFLSIVGIVVACTGLSMVAYGLITNKLNVQQPTATGTGSDHTDVAQEASDETTVEPAAIATYKVAADQPRILKIDALKISARVKPMDVNSIGAVQAPVNIYDSGWYTGSSKPGAYGAVFIDGHASGATRKGLFAYLDTLKNGNTVSIERGDGEVLQYKVVHVETVSKDVVDMSKVLRTYNHATEGLNMMTCTGKWIESEKTYDKRVIVYTERVA
jgi:LPXTG-site transpeptidase (sortase) family protein